MDKKKRVKKRVNYGVGGGGRGGDPGRGGGWDGMVSLIRNMVLEFVRINGMHSMPYLIVKKKI